MTLVAGNRTEYAHADGAGTEARFSDSAQMASDGAGNLFMCERSRIRRIQLPVAWRAGAGDGALAAGGGHEAATAVVSTLPYEAPSYLLGMVLAPPTACSSTSTSSGSSSSGSAESLVLSTRTALYRLQLPASPPAATAAAGAGAGAGVGAPPATLQAQLLAGEEVEVGCVDGRGSEARLTGPCGLATDAAGRIYFTVESVAPGNTACVRAVSPDGTVTTLVTDLPHTEWWSPAVLPNGYLALGGDEYAILLLDLGLPPVLPLGRTADTSAGASAAAAGPPPRSLHGDLGAVLDAQPDDSADVIIRVGERRFHAHRLILSARCDYFKQRLEAGGFANARAAELELPDTEPAAFSLLLRWLYTGGVAVPPEQAQGVAELADRLLLPELCAAAQAVVAASVTASAVVDGLLWAWGCSQSRDGGGGFGSLLNGLKQWYVEHQEEVRQQAGTSRQRLAAAPALMEELMDAVVDLTASATSGGVTS
ncbi:hypothetical protein HXX76_009219 [Chlamydomonas incerta]|uniref:BTB domain-containing protein n=1 Tax=Chlamydomonas incerta TaxID=51695 RepID=A0A835SRA0_CHLIN|nr:hypothetical protein HXX76_009219 [Chlamydomonas incerta]|eukprot:KAG2431723.1 hypothetical protein HXX76_009219 [Chlamydomonas incerta]